MAWIVLAAAHALPTRAATEAVLARDGQPTLPVLVRPDSSERVQAAAQELAQQLSRIVGGTFELREADTEAGIVVARFDQLPDLTARLAVDAQTPAGRETYLLRSHSAGLYVLGASDLAVEHAVWDLLYRLGFRQYFPGETWEVVPNRPGLAITVDATEAPDYWSRRIWYGSGLADHNREAYAQWCRRNRMVPGFNLKTGHAWGTILRHNREAFDAHPEYLALVDGKRELRGGSTKFCLSNSELRQLVVADRLAELASDPAADSVSLDPTDGGDWCECAPCAAMGSVSDQLVTLANEVAAAIVQTHGPHKYVGMYAYNEHSPPPSIPVHPNVIVSTATSFIRGGYTVDQLIEGWNRQGASIGIREYYSVFGWDHGLPGAARGSRINELQQTIPHFHRSGARFLTAESGDNWGPNGLGYYLASRFLWDIDATQHTDALVDDFLDNAFGSAREPMRRFYQMINLDPQRPALSEHLVAQMYRRLDEAARATTDPRVQQRIDDLILYTRYVELYRAYASATSKARQAAVEEMAQLAYRSRHGMLVHVKSMFRNLVRDKQITMPEQAHWDVPESENPWKQAPPPTHEEVRRILAQGIADNQPLAFEPVAFDRDLVPAASLGLEAASPPSTPNPSARGTRHWYTWVEHAPATIQLRVTGGLIKHYRNRGDVRVELFPLGETAGESVAIAHVPPDGETYPIELHTRFTGLHRIEISDGHDATRIEWPEGMAMTREASMEYPATFSGRWTMYFYVPAGMRMIGGYHDGAGGSIVAPDGRTALRFERGGEFFQCPVPEEQAGRVWKLMNVGGTLSLLTVPPYLARTPQELLLPQAVVSGEADASR